MGAVRLRFRAELRRRAAAWIGLGLLVGLAAGVAIAAAAGARRTESAYPRFLVAYKSEDVVFPDDGETPPPPDLAKIERLPQVAEAARGKIFYSLGDFAAFAPADETVGTRIHRFKVLSGRLTDPSRADEVLVGFAAAERLNLHVGSTFPLIEPEYEAEARKLGIENITLRVVGIEAAPGEFPPQYPGVSPLIHMTPTFYAKYSANALLPKRDSLLVRLVRGQNDVPAFIAGVERLARGKLVLFATQRQQTAPIQRSFHLQAIALWILAALVALAAALVFSQTLARQAFLESTEAPALRALGMTRAQLFGLAMARAAVVALAAGVAGVVIGVALSPLTPIGTARTAEPDPGFAADAAVLAIGGCATVLLVLALATLPAWRTVRLAGSPLGTPESTAAARPSAAVALLARLGAPPPAVAGVRLALEQGRGRTAVPVRTTLAGAALAVTALTAALVFGASLNHLLGTPRLYGWNWDLLITNYGAGPDLNRRAARLAATPGVAALSVGGGGIPLDIGHIRAVGAIAVDGPVHPPVLEGRAAAAPDEIELGTKTMRRVGVGIGDSVDARVPGLPTRRMRVVGRIVVPAYTDLRLGEGAAMTQGGLRRLFGRSARGSDLLGATDIAVRLEPGADPEAVLAALRPKFGEPFVVLPPEKPSDILNFGRVQNLPLVLAGILGVLGAGTLVHTLVSAGRRRRRDLAILKTLGFTRRQVVAVVLWQASTLAAIALAVGVPLGVALGRWAWALFADETGVVREAAIPGVQIAVAAAAALLLANLIAALPARVAARMHPAAALRAE